jgi:hypothetical protein
MSARSACAPACPASPSARGAATRSVGELAALSRQRREDNARDAASAGKDRDGHGRDPGGRGR